MSVLCSLFRLTYREWKYLLISLLFSSSVDLYSQSEATDRTLIRWSDGLKVDFIDSSDQLRSEFRLGGRIHYDLSFFKQDQRLSETVGTFENGHQFRRIFFYHSGQLNYGGLNYRIQLDFTGGRIGFRDVYVEPQLFNLKSGLQGHLRIGQFKDPFRFENQLSSNQLSLMERSYISNFAPLRNTGFMFHLTSAKQAWSFQAAGLTNADDSGNELFNDDGYNITTRIALLPVKKEQMVLHAAFGYSLRDAGARGIYSYHAKPPVQKAPDYINFSIAGVDETHLVNLESALINQRLMIISELMLAKVQANHTGHLQAFYTQVSYFLTRNNYHTYQSSLTGIRDQISDHGAFEIVGRYSFAHIDHINTTISRISDITLGVNYYLNEHFRVMLNFSHVELAATGESNGVDIRFMTYF